MRSKKRLHAFSLIFRYNKLMKIGIKQQMHAALIGYFHIILVRVTKGQF